MTSSQEERIRFLISEEIAIVDYDPLWPASFNQEASLLRQTLPSSIVRKIGHFGSTSVPGLASKPIIDILVEVRSLEQTRNEIVPILQASGYEYFWRPNTSHPHGRTRLRAVGEILEVAAYSKLKRILAAETPHDRAAYTEKKTEYIVSVTQRAKIFFQSR